MNRDKIIIDALFILVSTLLLIGLNHSGLLEKYIGFALVPILASYFIGQFVRSKFK